MLEKCMQKIRDLGFDVEVRVYFHSNGDLVFRVLTRKTGEGENWLTEDFDGWARMISGMLGFIEWDVS